MGRVARGGVTVRGTLYLSGLVLLAGLSYGLFRLVESSLRELGPAESQAPVLTVERLRAVRMNSAGKREYVIEAPQLWQSPGQGGVRVEQPTLDWYQPDGQVREWRVKAESGWSATDRQIIRLDGIVTMIRTAASGKPPMTVTTRDIVIRAGGRYAETVAPTQVAMPNGELQTTGARVWLDQQRLELLSEVRGFYDPAQR